jgi:hypothetical protein
MRITRRGSCALSAALIVVVLGAAWLASPTSTTSLVEHAHGQRSSQARAGTRGALVHLDDAILGSSSLHRASEPHPAQLALLSAVCEALAAASLYLAIRTPRRRHLSHLSGAASRAPPFESFA